MGAFFNNEITGSQTILKADTGKTFFVNSKVAATKILTSTGTQVTANDTVTLSTTVYKFVVSPSAAFDVDIGANAQGSIDNLIKAINLTGVAGTTYGTATTLHPTVSASSGGALKVLATAKRAGVAGNNIVLAEAAVTLSWEGGAVLLSGGAPTPNETNRDLILTLPQDADDGNDFNFIFTDNGESRNDSEEIFTSWTLSSGLTKPFIVAMNDSAGNPYNFRRVLNTLGTLQQVKLGGIRQGNRIKYVAGEQIKFVSWGGVYYSTPPFGSGFYGVGEV